MPSLFRRKSTDVIDEAPVEVPAEPSTSARPKGYTPSKKELGVVTPKRPNASRRAPEPPPANRREAYKRMRERQREDSIERREGMARGDEQYLLPRDRGPERALVRDIVDARRTVGPFFFGTAFLVLIASVFKDQQQAMLFGLVANLVWALFFLATIVDSTLIARKIGKLVRERFPRTEQRMGSLYIYGIMRAISFRRLRVPKPRVALGTKV